MPSLIPKPPDPRPSKAHPVQRARRKELEKKHGGYEWVPYLGLALTGLVLAFNVEKDVEKCEKRKEGKNQDSDGDGGRGRRGQSSRRGGSRERDRDRDRGDRGRGRSLDRDYERERYNRQREDGGYGRDDGAEDRRRLEGRLRDYEYYGGGRGAFEPWDERRAYDRRSAW